ncbi:MAG: 50S ribosomal protein L28 [Bdellovibrionales bacterium]|nr:50S ribosomal protein L28 [Bdellovibrionales bacterium]
MAKVCELSGVGPMSGNKVSHSNRKTRTRWLPNLKKKKYPIESLGRTMTLTLSARAIRTIDKQGGIVPAILQAKEENLSDRLATLKRSIIKARA